MIDSNAENKNEFLEVSNISEKDTYVYDELPIRINLFSQVIKWSDLENLSTFELWFSEFRVCVGTRRVKPRDI